MSELNDEDLVDYEEVREIATTRHRGIKWSKQRMRLGVVGK